VNILQKVLILFFFSAQSYGASLEDLAQKLLTLRAEVEQSGRELESERKLLQNDVDALLQRKAELRNLLQKEELRSYQLIEKIKVAKVSVKQKISQLKGSSEFDRDTHSSLTSWATALQVSIENSIPWNKQKRLSKVNKSLEKIRDFKFDSTITEELWQITEEEFKLTQDNQFEISKLNIENVEMDSEVVRIGRSHMLFKTAAGHIGYSMPGENGYAIQLNLSQEEKLAAERVLKRFREKKESGWFEIPGLATLSKEKGLSYAR